MGFTDCFFGKAGGVRGDGGSYTPLQDGVTASGDRVSPHESAQQLAALQKAVKEASVAKQEASLAQAQLLTARQELANMALAHAAGLPSRGSSNTGSSADAALAKQLSEATSRARNAEAVCMQQHKQLQQAQAEVQDLKSQLQLSKGSTADGKGGTGGPEENVRQELASLRSLVKAKTEREAELSATVEALRKEVTSTRTLHTDDSNAAAQLHQDLTALRREYAALQAEVKAKEDMFELLQTQLNELSDVDVDKIILESRTSSRRMASRQNSLAMPAAVAE